MCGRGFIRAPSEPHRVFPSVCVCVCDADFRSFRCHHRVVEGVGLHFVCPFSGRESEGWREGAREKRWREREPER